jgi:hypothetical protein
MLCRAFNLKLSEMSKLISACEGGYSGLPVDDGPNECVTVKGFNHVLCAAWHQGDNSGPHTADEVCQPAMESLLEHLESQADLHLMRQPPGHC